MPYLSLNCFVIWKPATAKKNKSKFTPSFHHSGVLILATTVWYQVRLLSKGKEISLERFLQQGMGGLTRESIAQKATKLPGEVDPLRPFHAQWQKMQGTGLSGPLLLAVPDTHSWEFICPRQGCLDLEDREQLLELAEAPLVTMGTQLKSQRSRAASHRIAGE